jgi:hypothetical protein
MGKKSAIAVALLAVTIPSGIWHFKHRDPFDAPGQTWQIDFILAGDTLRLMDSGRYVSYHWCDICVPIEYKSGTWSKTRDVVTLTPDSVGEKRRRYREQTNGKCRYLVPLDLRIKTESPIDLALQPEAQNCRLER